MGGGAGNIAAIGLAPVTGGASLLAMKGGPLGNIFGGPGSSTSSGTSYGPAQSAESIGAGTSIDQAIRATGLTRGGTLDPRVQLATMDSYKGELGSQLALAQQRYAENMSALGSNPQARGNADALFSQISALKQQISELDASRPILEEQAGLAQGGSDVSKQFVSKLQRGLETGNFVDPTEMDAIRTAMSSVSQDVATSRNLNRSDVPVMQAIAPTLASMWLGQQNSNKGFLTGAYQVNQGLGLQTSGQNLGVSNPGLGLASVYSGLRGSNVSGNQQNRYGFLDYANAASGMARGVGSAMASGGGGGGGGGYT